MIDYAHNPAGFSALSKFLERIDSPHKVGVIAGVGDRRNEDILSLGRLSGRMFDEVIIRQDKNLRGRTDQEIIDLMVQGIQEVAPGKKYTVIPKESQAIDYAIQHAQKGSFITICSDVVPDALDQIMRYKEQEDKFEIRQSDIPNQRS